MHFLFYVNLNAFKLMHVKICAKIIVPGYHWYSNFHLGNKFYGYTINFQNPEVLIDMLTQP